MSPKERVLQVMEVEEGMILVDYKGLNAEQSRISTYYH